MLFAVSDVVYQALIAAAVAVILGYLQMRTQTAVKRAADSASEAATHAAAVAKVLTAKTDQAASSAAKAVEVVAVKAEEVKQTLSDNTEATAAKLEGLAKVAVATHTLVNSNMAQQLRLNAAVTRRLADLTREPADAKAADLAEQLSAEHAAKQAVVDRQAREDVGT